MRDTQRARLYRADDVLRTFAEPLPSVKDVERFVRKVWRSKRVQQAFPKATRDKNWLPRVKDGRGCRRATGWAGGISIPLWARKTDVVIHELAHAVTDREFGGSVAWHGWEFCSVYLKLVLYMMGREAHDALKASFKEHKVRFRPKRKRPPMTEEQKNALALRLLTAASERRAKQAA